MATSAGHKASDVAPDSTMVAIYPPKGWVDLLAAQAHPSQRDKLHTTLVFLGDTTPEQAEKALEVVRKAVARHCPIKMTCNGAAVFDNPDAIVRVLQPSGVGLAELRAAVYTALDKAKLLDKQTHGFVPHMTLEYHTDRKLPEHWERVAQLPFGRWTVTDVRVVRGDKEIGRAALAPTVKESQMTPFEQGYYAFLKVAFGVEDVTDEDDGPSRGEALGLTGAGGLMAGSGLALASEVGGMPAPTHLGGLTFGQRAPQHILDATAGSPLLNRVGRGMRTLAGAGVGPRMMAAAVPLGLAAAGKGLYDMKFAEDGDGNNTLMAGGAAAAAGGIGVNTAAKRLPSLTPEGRSGLKNLMRVEMPDYHGMTSDAARNFVNQYTETGHDLLANPAVISGVDGIPRTGRQFIERLRSNPIAEFGLKRLGMPIWNDATKAHYDAFAQSPAAAVEMLMSESDHPNMLRHLTDRARAQGTLPDDVAQRVGQETMKKMKNYRMVLPHLETVLDAAPTAGRIGKGVAALGAGAAGLGLWNKLTPED